ncbi:WASH complex subunit 3 [Galleria mellonella]|uniref:WASH complex subunit 3 n=1 Tax=Galleria mellonella TaxID=7137 RepID=A0A6J1WEP5_GALME|nr:WASH complex subunit 3 [Galleria mellonella]
MTMQEAMVKEEIANLDLTKVAALQQKRTLAFINHFLVTTVQFMNHFMKKCEQKLMHFERKLEKVEAAMVLLEARLSSIPEANIVETETQPTQNTVTKSEDMVDQNEANTKLDSEDVNEEVESKETSQSQPEYDRFVKMVQVGVPLQAVKLKVSMEGLDPNVLEKIVNK